MTRGTKGFSKVADVLKKFDVDEDKYISYEFQKYGYELAEQLGDLIYKDLFFKSPSFSANS